MNKRLLILLSALFFVSYTYSQERKDEVERFWTFYCAHFDNADSEFSVFEYPKQILSYEGTKIEVRATVSYRFDAVAEKYDGLVLVLRFLPLDSGKFGAGIGDSIRMYARQSTVVQNVCEAKAGAECRIESNADMYSRAFCMADEVDESKITVEYEMVFNPLNTESNVMNFRLRKADWTESDSTLPVKDNEGFGGYMEKSWIFRLHDAGYRYCEDDGQWRMSYIEPTFNVLSNISVSDGAQYIEVIGKNVGAFSYANVKCKCANEEKVFGARLLGQISDAPLTESLFVSAKNPDKVIMEKDTPLPYSENAAERLPFTDNDKETYCRYRASAERFALDSYFFIRQSSYSLLFYYKDK